MSFVLSNHFQTPPEVCWFMCRMASKHFVSVRQWPGQIAKVLEPTPGLGNLIIAGNDTGFSMYGPGSADDYWESWVYKQDPLYFDMVLMNPPFNPVDEMEKFVIDATNKSHYIVALLPWTYIINSERRLNKLMDFGLVSVTNLPRKTFPGCRVQTCVFQLKSGHIGHTIFNKFTF